MSRALQRVRSYVAGNADSWFARSSVSWLGAGTCVWASHQQRAMSGLPVQYVCMCAKLKDTASTRSHTGSEARCEYVQQGCAGEQEVNATSRGDALMHCELRCKALQNNACTHA